MGKTGRTPGQCLIGSRAPHGLAILFRGIRFNMNLRIHVSTLRCASPSMPNVNSRLHIGISGWTYPPWRNGAFYPVGLAQKRELEYASRQVNSIEINGSFYSLQFPSSYRAWYAATPPGFIFAVKGGRFITHMKRLRNIDAPLANFFASGPLLLKEKLGPILWQLPPMLKFDRDLLDSFFRMLPRDTKQAAALARRHDQRLDGR